MSTSSTSCFVPYLPLEILAHILQSLPQASDDDLTYLWTSCRPVSKFFKEEVEFIFRDRHLPKMRLTFDSTKPFLKCSIAPYLIHSYYLEGYPIQTLDAVVRHCEWVFSNVSRSNKDVAIFVRKEDEDRYLSPQTISNIIAKKDRKDYTWKPQRTVQVRREANDLDLPALSVDYEKMELSLNWNDLFCRFYAEQKLINTWLHSQR